MNNNTSYKNRKLNNSSLNSNNKKLISSNNIVNQYTISNNKDNVIYKNNKNISQRSNLRYLGQPMSKNTQSPELNKIKNITPIKSNKKDISNI
jgi:hypothetical protein